MPPRKKPARKPDTESDSEQEDLAPPSSEPPQIDPYEVLSVERTATDSQIKTAYHKAALKNHPDKVAPSERDGAKTKFQAIAFAYAILSDPARRRRYDTTGSTSESIVDSDDFDWSDYFRAQYADVITEESIAKFAAVYKGSEEERDDVLAAYDEFEGDMDGVYETVMLSDVAVDDARFRAFIDEAIKKGEVRGYKKYTGETKRSRQARVGKAKKEEKEAEELARELGVGDKLKGKGGKNKGDDEAGLAALIRQNQAKRGGFLDQLAEKYGAKPSKSKVKGKRGATDLDDDDDDDDEGPSPHDIPDDEFEAIQAKMKANKKAKKAR